MQNFGVIKADVPDWNPDGKEDFAFKGPISRKNGALVVTHDNIDFTLVSEEDIKEGDTVTFSPDIIPHPTGGPNNGAWIEYKARDVKRV